ncbi:orexin receptor type 1 [Biomphalaria glabrata]|uniref:G-protein coupled receptors family 1 profile domain-containing protein n=1 Tax=Biomphalaria glabrata TaxID=6526 RepID=A0A2C9LXA8_BIOGL|nr:orexin receptor type 1 [Biomphalaria glabrata]
MNDSNLTNVGTTTSKIEAHDRGDVTRTELLVVTVMLSVFSVTGTIGNALAIYVFSSLKQKLTSTIFILTLAGTDFVTCLITIPFTILMEYLDFHVASDEICKIYHFLITTTVPFSCVVIVAIAVDRYMCICHPFHHWMTIQRARIIIGFLVIIIFAFGSIVSAHYSIYSKAELNRTINQLSNASGYPMGGAYDFTKGDTAMTFTPDPFSPGPSYSQAVRAQEAGNRSDVLFSTIHIDMSTQPTPNVLTSYLITKCDLNENLIGESFFRSFKKLYVGIFFVSCLIVFALYSLIYRSVIAQRKKKLRIKSAQCCLLWNATSLDSPHELAEMTQDIELSHVNGDDRCAVRHNSATPEDLEPHNNGAVRKCSLSKARIERMRVANIKTAFTLFIVTLVFILAFLPSWLMALNAISMKIVVFYMHFVYNVANPFIYAFLNQNFKNELRRIFHCGKK